MIVSSADWFVLNVLLAVTSPVLEIVIVESFAAGVLAVQENEPSPSEVKTSPEVPSPVTSSSSAPTAPLAIDKVSVSSADWLVLNVLLAVTSPELEIVIVESLAGLVTLRPADPRVSVVPFRSTLSALVSTSKPSPTETASKLSSPLANTIRVPVSGN